MDALVGRYSQADLSEEWRGAEKTEQWEDNRWAVSLRNVLEWLVDGKIKVGICQIIKR